MTVIIALYLHTPAGVSAQLSVVTLLSRSVDDNRPLAGETLMANADSYSWIGGTAGTWGTAANWEDLTTGTVAAVAPGIDSAATIGAGVTITGPGSAASLEIQGADSVSGNLDVGTLVVDSNGNLDLDTSATISAATATIVGGLMVNGPSTDLLISGVLQIEQSGFLQTPLNDGLAVTAGGLVQAGSLILNTDNGTAGDIYPLDNASTIEIGNAGTAVAGVLTIDPGQTISGTGALFVNEGTGSDPNVSIVNNGLIISSQLTLGQVVRTYSQVILSPQHEAIDFYAYEVTGNLTGTGSVEVETGGTINLVVNVNGSETFQLDGSASLNLYQNVAAGSTIVMDGHADMILMTSTLDGIEIGSYYTSQAPGDLQGANPRPPIVAATIDGFDATDQIILQGLSLTGASWSGGTLDLLQGTNVVDTLTLNGDYADRSFVVTGTTYAGQPREIVTLVACFAAGTRIDTRRGAIQVEHLREGDMVLTVSGGCQPIQWIGHRTLDLRRHPAPEQVQPIRIAPHAFGNNRPRQPLLLSPDHAVYAEGVLIPVKYLSNGTTITQLDKAAVTYYHIELPRHDVVLAQGLPTESYLDTGDRSNFANGGGTMRLFPDFSTRSADASLIWDAYGYAPLIVTGPELAAVRQRLEERARQTTPESPATNRTQRQPEAIAEPTHRSRRA
jgi:hypothetical protein